jgi:methylenetetrahydrofolate--tRNA-(uracil-5-)-methyltransferase
MACADAHRVPAGSAVAVDRDGFSDRRPPARCTSIRLIEVVRERVDPSPPRPPSSPPAPHRSAARRLDRRRHRAASLAFFDAIAPIVYRDSIDMDVAWMASRWDKQAEGSEGDYINCPMTKDQYLAFPRAARGREDRLSRVGEGHALFRRLHADRGDGERARIRCATGR